MIASIKQKKTNDNMELRKIVRIKESVQKERKKVDLVSLKTKRNQIVEEEVLPQSNIYLK